MKVSPHPLFDTEMSMEHYLIPHVQDVLQVDAHAVVLDGEEDGVEDDAEGHHEVEDGVVDKFVQDVLQRKMVFDMYITKKHIKTFNTNIYFRDKLNFR